MFADEFRPNTTEEKQILILNELNKQINAEARYARLGIDNRDEIFHIQKQIQFHRDCLLSLD